MSGQATTTPEREPLISQRPSALTRIPELGSIPAGVANNLADLKKAGVPVLAYGSFITILVNFIILAFVIFLMIKQINRLRRTEEAAPAPAEPAEDIVLLREIRDSLKRS